MTCKNHYMTLKMALTAHNALRDHVPFRALYTTLPVKVRHLMGKWGHYRRKVKFYLIIIIFGQVRRAGLKSPTDRIRPGGRTLPMSGLVKSRSLAVADTGVVVVGVITPPLELVVILKTYAKCACPRGVLVNDQEWGYFEIFWRADDITRTMSKGGGGTCECLHLPPPPSGNPVSAPVLFLRLG